MTDKEFIEKIYELAFGDGAYDKGYSNHKEVLHQINELLIENWEVL